MHVEVAGEVVIGEEVSWLNLITDISNVTLEQYVSNKVVDGVSDISYKVKVKGYDFSFVVSVNKYNELKYLLCTLDSRSKMLENSSKMLEEIKCIRESNREISDMLESRN